MRPSRSQAGWLGSPSGLMLRPMNSAPGTNAGGGADGTGGGATGAAAGAVPSSQRSSRKAAAGGAGASGAPSSRGGGFGTDYFLRIPHAHSILGGDIDATGTGGESDDGHGGPTPSIGGPPSARDRDRDAAAGGGGSTAASAASGARRRRVPLPFLDACTLPTWKSAPRRERDAYWTRLKSEIFSLVDDRFLVDQCLLEPHQLVDTSFRDKFVKHKRELYRLPPPPPPTSQSTAAQAATPARRSHSPPPASFPTHTHACGSDGVPFFITQVQEEPDGVGGGSNTSTSTNLAALQHRLRALVSDPSLRTRLALLRTECECARADAAQAERAAEEERKRRRKAAADAQAAADKANRRAGVRSPSRAAAGSAKPSRVASKLAGALANADADAGADEGGDGDDDDEYSSDQRAPKLSAYLRSEEEKSDEAALAALERSSREQLEEEVRALAEQAEESSGEGRGQGQLRSEWLERAVNLVFVRAGFRVQVEAAWRRRGQAQQQAAGRKSSSSPSSSSGTPGSEFLPPPLFFLAHHPGSFRCAQGVLRDVLRCSTRLRHMVRRGLAHEGVHPHTGQAMLSLVLCEDDATRFPQAEHLFWVQALRWMQTPALRAFMEYARRPFVWRQEKVARERVENMSRVQKEHQELFADLETERTRKLSMLRDLQSVHKLRVLNELESKLEREIARLRREHLANVAVELDKIAEEVAGMEVEIDAYYAQEKKEMQVMQRKVVAKKTQQLQKELSSYTAKREEVLPSEHLTKLCLLAHDLEANDLFDDTIEIISLELPRFVTDTSFLSPLLERGTHRLLFAQASLDDLKHVADQRGVSTAAIEKAVARALSSTQVIDGPDAGVSVAAVEEGGAGAAAALAPPTIAQAKSAAKHVQTLVELHRESRVHDEVLRGVLGAYADRVEGGHLLTQADLAALEGQLRALLASKLADCASRQAHIEAALSSSSSSSPTSGQVASESDDLRHVRLLLRLVNECVVRSFVCDEIEQRVTMVQQVLLPAGDADADAAAVAAAAAASALPDDAESALASRVVSLHSTAPSLSSEATHSVQTIISQITRAHKGTGSVRAVELLAAQRDEARLAERVASVGAASTKPNRRNHIARTLLKELVRRVIAGFKRRPGWLEVSAERPGAPATAASTAATTAARAGGAGGSSGKRDGVPTCLRLSQHARRITVVRPFRYGSLHCNIGFPRLDPALPAQERQKQKWFFEVRIGAMDEGAATVMVGWDIDPPEPGSQEAQEGWWAAGGDDAAGTGGGAGYLGTPIIDDGLPHTMRLRSTALLAREHASTLESFERTQYDRFARALPMLAAASAHAGVAPTGDGASAALAKHIGQMLHAANEKAATAQAAAQLQILQARQAQPGRIITHAQAAAVLGHAAATAAQNALQFVPPAHLATHPAFSSPAHLTQALVAQATQAGDPLADSPFQLFNTAAYHLSSLSAPPPSRLAQRASGVMWQSDGVIYAHGASWQSGVGFTEGDVVGCGLDLDGGGAVYFVKNGHVFLAAPPPDAGGQLDLPLEMEHLRYRPDRAPGAGALQRQQQGEMKAGPVLGQHKVMEKRLRTGEASEQPHRRGGEADSATPSPDPAAGPARSSSPRSKSRVRSASRRRSSKKKRKSKRMSAKEALHAAIAASAAAGTEVSLLDSPDTPPDSPRAEASPESRRSRDYVATSTASRSPATNSTTAAAAAPTPAPDAMAILKTPLHGSSASSNSGGGGNGGHTRSGSVATNEPASIEQIEKGNVELQRRLALTTGAAPIDVPPPQPLFPSPLLSHVPASPASSPTGAASSSRSRASPSPSLGRAFSFVESGAGASARPDQSSPPSSSLSPTNGGGASSRLAKNLAAAGGLHGAGGGGAGAAAGPGSPAGMRPASMQRRRERSPGLFGSNMSAVASLQQTQQAQLERQLASVATMQNVAAEALANAQEVYNHNQAKAELLNAAIAAHTVPDAPVFEELQRRRRDLAQEARERADAQTVYHDLEQAAGLARFHSRPRRRVRRLKRREQAPGQTGGGRASDGADASTIDYTSDDGDDDGWDGDGQGLEDWALQQSEHGSLPARAVLAGETPSLPTTLPARSFHSAPLYFQHRFGVALLLPAPRLHRPALLSTQQLAQAFAAGVSSLAASDNLAQSLDSALHHAAHMLLLNQSLVRTALHAATTAPTGQDAILLQQQQQLQADSADPDVDYMDFGISSTTLLQTQPLQPPSPRSLRGRDLAGSAVAPTASRARPSPSPGGVTSPGEHSRRLDLARVANAVLKRDALSAAAPSGMHMALGAGSGEAPLLAAQSAHRAAGDVLVQGRASYTLRPCVTLYSTKPNAPLQHASTSARDPNPSSAGWRPRDSVSSGPRASISVNFEGPFLFPLHGFRPVKHAQ